jgi:hypothetical protein
LAERWNGSSWSLMRTAASSLGFPAPRQPRAPRSGPTTSGPAGRTEISG